MTNQESYFIEPASIDDAGFIAETVMGAIGRDHCIGLGGGGPDSLKKVFRLFKGLAELESSQYSYNNTLIARDDSGMPIGAIVAYDGARLRDLRPLFVDSANKILGWKVSPEEAETWEDEASPDEFYLDSLYVVPRYRGMGVAKKLIKAIVERNDHYVKPFGLLVDPDNTNAMKIYESLGFKKVGTNSFIGIPMLHMQYRQNN